MGKNRDRGAAEREVSGTAGRRAWPTTNSTACWPRARGHSYTGFWTRDPGTVGTVLDELDALAE